MYLYGASGHAKVIVDVIKSDPNLDTSIDGIFDDDEKKTSFLNITFLGKFETNKVVDSASYLISIGNNKVRKIIAKKVNASFFKAIHKSAVVSETASIDEGSVVMQYAVINAEATIGKHCIINTGAIIEHDCQLKDFAHISPGAVVTGNVSVGEGTQVGAGAVVIPNISIGKWCTIGAGAVIIEDIPDFAVVVGNPGKIIKYNPKK